MPKPPAAAFVWRHLFLIVAAIGVAHAQDVAAPAQSPPSELQKQLEAMVESGPFDVHGARVAHPHLIYAFYSQRSFRPAWNNAHTASELRRALKDSEADGLDPTDYHLAVLEELASTGSTLAAYEILHTDALLRVADHLSFGKVDPTSFDPHWNYGRTHTTIDIPQRIEAAITADDIYERIEKLKPTHRLYRALKQELARYRAVSPDATRLTVPAGKSIEPGAHDARVPALRARLAYGGDLDPVQSLTSDLYDPALQSAVQRFQERMGLVPDGTVGARTIAELNVPIEARISQLRVNLDRGRVLLQDLPPEFVVVNIASYWIYFVRGEEVVWSARAQIGKTYRRTPMFRSTIEYLVLNPTWTVPPGIIRNDILPAAQRDPASITRRDLRVLDAGGKEVDPASVDWSRFKSGNIPYTLRQDPGPRNALGRVKFMFPNSYSVYLHDTPSQSLFEAPDRAFSSGCVRVERPLELAVMLLADPAEWSAETVRKTIDAGTMRSVTLANKMPVLLAYWTAWLDPQGRVNFRRDVYGQDAQWASALSREYSARPLTRSGPSD
jgi:murein L,D-transpeptidase YcbB/YkuD